MHWFLPSVNNNTSYAIMIKMNPLHIFSFIFSFILFTIFLYKWLIVNTKKSKLPPPNPPRLPIIGNLHQLGKFPHRSLRSLSDKYDDLMLLYLGNRPTLIVSSASAAEQTLKTHDLICANRPNLRFIKHIFYDGNDVAFSSYSEKWTHMKSICVTHLLSNKKVESFRRIREHEIGGVIEEIRSYNGVAFNLGETFLTLFKGLICKAALGRKYDDDTDFYELFKDLMKVMGEFSLGDYIPSLSWVDRLSGLEGRAENVRKKFDEFIEQVIQEHQIRLNAKLNDKLNNGENNEEDFVDAMLQIHTENPLKFSRDNIKATILDVFVAGTESCSTTFEWAMTELIRHPMVMRKLQEEVRFVARNKSRVTEDDVQNMTFLKAVIKESFRLHPPAPLLVFHETSNDIKLDKYDISAKTQVIINAWAIQQDSEQWRNPSDFFPERFLNEASDVDFKGKHYQLIPFSAGRRGCPGLSYATVTTELILANFIFEFNWTLPNGKEAETLDVEESWGLTVKRKNPLMVIASPNVHS